MQKTPNYDLNIIEPLIDNIDPEPLNENMEIIDGELLKRATQAHGTLEMSTGTSGEWYDLFSWELSSARGVGGFIFDIIMEQPSELGPSIRGIVSPQTSLRMLHHYSPLIYLLNKPAYGTDSLRVLSATNPETDNPVYYLQANWPAAPGAKIYISITRTNPRDGISDIAIMTSKQLTSGTVRFSLNDEEHVLMRIEDVNKKIVTGYYAGDGTGMRVLDLGGRPKFVVISTTSTGMWLAIDNKGIREGAENTNTLSASGSTVSMVANGFAIVSNGVQVNQQNENGKLYEYLAIM